MPATIKTVTGVFPTADGALRAGERAREIAGPRATIRVMVPGATGKIIETSVLCDTSSYWRVPILGLVLGVMLAVGLGFYGVSIGYILVGLLASVASGAMMGLWLGGELYPRRIFSARMNGNERYVQTILSGRSVVTAIVKDTAHATAVTLAFKEAGADVAPGFLHQHGGATAPVLPAPLVSGRA